MFTNKYCFVLGIYYQNKTTNRRNYDQFNSIGFSLLYENKINCLLKCINDRPFISLSYNYLIQLQISILILILIFSDDILPKILLFLLIYL